MAQTGTLLIGGHWVPAESEATFASLDPATGRELGRVADGGERETRAAIAAAHEAFPGWSRTSPRERERLLHRVAALMQERRDELARLVTLEQGKPLAESYAEVDYAREFFVWFAPEARRIYGETLEAASPQKRWTVIRQPVGVVAAISPWNFPLATITKKIAPALAAGCTVVIKPAEQTPLCAVALAQILQEAELPPGAANLVTGSDPRPIGAELLGNPAVRAITFTGSTAVGKLLMREAAGQLKKVSLELGGHAPFIVFADADLEQAAAAAVACKFRTNGQTCTSANRLYVQAGVAPAFTARLAERVGALRLGNGLTPGVSVGPLIDRQGFDKVERHVADALEQGARAAVGGRPARGPECEGGHFYEPTVLTGVTHEMLICREETFGPVLPVIAFDTEAEVIRLANDTSYGLAAYFFTRDLSRAYRVAEALEYGVVGVNDPAPATPETPFGGWKQSGAGREGGHQGIAEFLETKFISTGLEEA